MTLILSQDTIPPKGVYPVGLITIKEYADRNGLTHDNVRHKCQRGAYKSAVKLGRDWLISEDEPDIDHRIKTGAYVGGGKHGSKDERCGAEK